MVSWARVNYRGEEDSSLPVTSGGGITALLPFSFPPLLWLYQHPCMPFGLWSFFLALQESFPGANPESSWRDLQLGVGAMLSSRALLWRSVVGNIISGSSAVLPNLGGKPLISRSVLFHNSLGLPGKPLKGGREGREEQPNIWGKFALLCWLLEYALMCEFVLKGEKAERA